MYDIIRVENNIKIQIFICHSSLIFKTHHYIIFFVRSLHGNRELLLIKYRPIIMVCLWCYNQSGVTELLGMKGPHYDRVLLVS